MGVFTPPLSFLSPAIPREMGNLYHDFDKKDYNKEKNFRQGSIRKIRKVGILIQFFISDRF